MMESRSITLGRAAPAQHIQRRAPAQRTGSRSALRCLAADPRRLAAPAQPPPAAPPSLREACCRAAAAALALALAITTELGPPPALAAGQAGVTPYDEGKAILLGPNAEGRVRPCGINPNCVSSSNLDDLYGPPWRSPVRPRGPGGPPQIGRAHV